MSDPAESNPSDVPVDDSMELAVAIARIADDKKASDVVVLDVGDVVSITGYFVVCSASNARLVRTVAEDVEDLVKQRFERSPIRTEGMREQQWVLVDYGDVVVHVFHDSQREFYALERLYGDVPRVAWQGGEARPNPLSSSDDDR